jgi:hypothetical protein
MIGFAVKHSSHAITPSDATQFSSIVAEITASDLDLILQLEPICSIDYLECYADLFLNW